MSSNEQLEQPLWELIYELLPPEEEAALLRRITSDPELARAYAKVRLQADMVTSAARINDPGGRVIPPDELAGDQDREHTTDFVVDAGASIEPARRRFTARRLANWMVAVAATGLLVMSVYALRQSQSPAAPEVALMERSAESHFADVATPSEPNGPGPIQTKVASPAIWNEDITNFVSVRTSSLDGTPAAASFEVKLFDDNGQVQYRQTHATDDTGAALVELSAGLSAGASRLEVTASDHQSPPIVTPARSAPSGHVTHLTTDLPAYEPGDTIGFRTLSLSRFDHRVNREVAVEFDVLDDQNEPIAGARQVVTSRRGVSSGSFKIPRLAAYKKLTVQARSPVGAFAPQQREVPVWVADVPQWDKKLKLARESYEPGDEVEGRLTVTTQDGEPAAGKKLFFQATADEQPIELVPPTAVTDAAGSYDFRFALPSSGPLADAALTVRVTDDEATELWVAPIPLHAGQADVTFFAEGGELVAGLRNEVYFEARSSQGEPVHLEGRIVDDEDQEVARATTVHRGRGKFSLTPDADQAYRLIVEKPAGDAQERRLPAVSRDAAVVLHCDGKTYAPGDAIDVTLRMRQPDRGLVLTAACRGSLVGLEAIEPSDFSVADDGTMVSRRALQLAPAASGVIRVTVYESNAVSPHPVAERLVFRRPPRRLDVRLDPIESARPGETISLGLQTVDETERPTPAALGISVANQAILNLADDQGASLETFVYLTSEIRGAADLEDADFYLESGEEAAAALDLLLGTRGWRRIEAVDASLLARIEQSSAAEAFAQQFDADLGTPPQPLRSGFALAPGGDSDPLVNKALVPLVQDNRALIEERQIAAPVPAPATRSTRSSPADPPVTHLDWGTILLICGLVMGLIVLAAIASLVIARSLSRDSNASPAQTPGRSGDFSEPPTAGPTFSWKHELRRPRFWIPTAAMATTLGLLWIGFQGYQQVDSRRLATDRMVAATEETAGAAAPLSETAPPAAEGDSLSDGMSTVNDFNNVRSAESKLSDLIALDAEAAERDAGSAGGEGLGGGFGGGVVPTDAMKTAPAKAGRGYARPNANNAPVPLRDTQASQERADEAMPPVEAQSAAPRRQLDNVVEPAGDTPRISNARPTAETGSPRGRLGKAAAATTQPKPGLPSRLPSKAGDESPDRPQPAPTAPLAATQLADLPPQAMPASAANQRTVVPPTAVPKAAGMAPLRQAVDANRLAGRSRRFRRVYAGGSLFAADLPQAPRSLHWAPLVVTDADGRASISVTLPSTDAAYQVRADAHGNGRIGSGQTTINVRQP